MIKQNRSRKGEDGSTCQFSELVHPHYSRVSKHHMAGDHALKWEQKILHAGDNLLNKLVAAVLREE
jgi:hypothetical protein